MRLRRSLALSCLLLGLTGCAVNRTLTFPPGGEHVVVTVKSRDDLAVRPIKIGYRSESCTLTNYTSDLKPYEKAAYSVISRDLTRQEGTELFSVKVAVNGGGRCEWRLSYIKFGVDYKEFKKFGHDVVSGGGGEVYVLLDGNAGPRGRSNLKVGGDLVMKEDYYVWVQEHFVGGYSKFGNLIRSGELILTYEAPRARQIYFEPVVRSKYPIYTKGPAIKLPGARTSHLYPDGTVVETRDTRPDFRKLHCIRLPSECGK